MFKKALVLSFLMLLTLCLLVSCGGGEQKTVTDFSIDLGSFPTEYELNSTYDLSALSLKVTYSDNSTDKIPVTANMVTGMETKTAGLKNIIITYKGKTKSFTVTVFDPSEVVYNVSFDIEGVTVEPEEVKTSNILSNPPVPVRNGFVFNGWYKDKDFNVPIVWVETHVFSDFTVYGRWVNSEDGEIVLATKITEEFTRKNLPSVHGYSLENWYRDEACSIVIHSEENVGYNETTTEQLTVYTKWTRNNYSISYKNASVTDAFVTEYNVETEDIILPVVSRGWVTFDGWYSDIGYNKKITEIPFGSVGDKTFYAKWSFGEDFVAIDSIDKLTRVGNNPSGKYYLSASIDLNGASFTPIGSVETPFSGIFDGNGYSISNYTLSSTKTVGGLFAYNSGQIGTLTVNGISIATAPQNSIYGGLCGMNNENGKITDCSSISNVNNLGIVYGGLCGQNDGSINNCYAGGSILSKTVGGLCGINNGKISLSNSNVVIASSNELSIADFIAGGLVGLNKAEIENSHSEGSISVNLIGNNGYVGGLVGQSEGDGSNLASINYCYSTVIVGIEESGNMIVGGLVGENSFSDVSYSYSCGDIRAESGTSGYVGGLLGRNIMGTIQKSFTISLINVTNATVGGLVGMTSENKVVSCYRYEYQGLESAANTEGEEIAFSEIVKAAFFKTTLGFENGRETENLKVLAKYEVGASSARPIEINNSTELLALQGNVRMYYRLASDINLLKKEWEGINLATLESGFDGNGYRIYNFIISSVASNGYTGFFGINNGTVTDLWLDDFTYDVSASQTELILGGLVGYNKGVVRNCIVTGTVIGSTTGKALAVGGVVGINLGTIENCLATGIVSGVFKSGSDDNEGLVGGIVGDNKTNATLTNCYRYSKQGVFPESNTLGNSVEKVMVISSDWYQESLKISSDKWSLTGLANSLNQKINGESTESTPINITNLAELEAIPKATRQYYRLMVNINLDGASWTPINLLTSGSGFDGNGHRIYNFQISSFQNSGYIGFFGEVEGKVRSFTVEEVAISYNGSGELRVGGVIGCLKGEADSLNSTSTISVTATKVYVGGVIGYLDGGDANNCKDKASVFNNILGSELCGGGVVGYAYNGEIRNCSSESGDYKGVKARRKLIFGGIVGQVESTEVSNAMVVCSITAQANKGDYTGTAIVRVGGIVGECASVVINGTTEVSITATGDTVEVGGIVGYLTQNGSIQSCEMLSGTLLADSGSSSSTEFAAAGGVVGYGYYGIIANSKVGITGNGVVNVTAKGINVSYAGGLAGRAKGSTGLSFTTSQVRATVKAESQDIAYSGGFIGENSLKIESCTVKEGSSVSIEAETGYLGGFVGYNFDLITSCKAGDGVEGMEILASTGVNLDVGGFVGEQGAEGVISASTSKGELSVSASGVLKVGGFAGEKDGSMDKNYSDVSIDVESDGDVIVGGFVGQNNSAISLAYSVGEMIARTSTSIVYIGGFVGRNYSTITKCYTLSAVSCASDTGSVRAGGFVGLNASSALVSYSFCAGDIVLLSVNQQNRYSYFGCFEINGDNVKDSTFYRYGTTITVDGIVTENVSESWGANKTQFNDNLTEEVLHSTADFLMNEYGLDWSADDWTFADGEYPVLK